MRIIEIGGNICEKYLDKIARIHLNAYSKEHFTSCFSVKKIKEYYLELIKASDVSIIALKHNDVVGFIIAGESVSAGVDAFIKRNRFYLMVLLVSHPWFLYQKAIMFLRNTQVASEPSEAHFRLLSIAVDPGSQSRKVGTDMLDFLERVLIERSVSLYGLSVREANHRAVGFYERRGFVLEKQNDVSRYYFKTIQ